jgi:hypothetical protein
MWIPLSRAKQSLENGGGEKMALLEIFLQQAEFALSFLH